MTKKYNYKIFPETTGMRVLLALGFLAGVALFVGYFLWIFAFALPGGPFGWTDFWDDIDVTYVNETDQTVAVYLDDGAVATIPAGESVTHSYKKIEWWVNQSIVARDLNGGLIYATEADKDDLKDLDYRIVIRGP